jgi:hypothetical protein
MDNPNVMTGFLISHSGVTASGGVPDVLRFVWIVIQRRWGIVRVGIIASDAFVGTSQQEHQGGEGKEGGFSSCHFNNPDRGLCGGLRLRPNLLIPGPDQTKAQRLYLYSRQRITHNGYPGAAGRPGEGRVPAVP